MTENRGQMQELPTGWIPVILDDLLTRISNGASVKQYDEKVGLPISRIETIWNETIDLQRVKYVKENDNEFVEKYRLKKGDILFSHINSDLHLGKTAIIISENLVLIHGINLLLLRTSELISSDFLNYHIKFYRVKGKFIEVAQRAVNQSSINQRKLRSFEIFLPPLPEQHRIVTKIEELFSELDNGIENLKKTRKQLKTYRQAVLKYAFEGKLTKEWRTQQRQAGNPPESAEKLLEQIKAEREKHYQKQLKDWKKAFEQAKAKGKKKPAKPKKPKELPPLLEKELAELPELPEGWGWVKLGCVVREIFDGPFGSNLKTKDYVEEGVRVIRLENIGVLDFINERKSCISEEKYNLIKKHKVFHGDIIFSSFISEQIRVIILPSYIKKAINKADCFCIRVTKSSLCNKYLMFYLSTRSNYNQLIHQVHGATRPRINTTQLRNCCIPLCSNHEQQQIVSEIESRLSVCDKLEQTIEDSLEKAEALRQSILKKAFAGELTKDWRERHPELIIGKNSAGKLLEKIKAEKALSAADRKKPRSKKMKKK